MMVGGMASRKVDMKDDLKDEWMENRQAVEKVENLVEN